MKSKIKFLIPSVSLVLFIALTVILCVSPVFMGTYRGNCDSWEKDYYEIKFSGSSFTYHNESQYYVNDSLAITDATGTYTASASDIELKYSNSNTTLRLKRNSVFVLVKTQRNNGGYGNVEVEVELKCAGAIALQVFYSIGTAASLLALIIFAAKKKK